MNFPVSRLAQTSYQKSTCANFLAQKNRQSQHLVKNRQANISNAKSEMEKLLYLRQPYPDNYTDASFLDQLKRNSTVANTHTASFSPIFLFAVSTDRFFYLWMWISTAIYSDLWRPPAPTLLAECLFRFGAFGRCGDRRRHKFKAYAVLLLILLWFLLCFDSHRINVAGLHLGTLVLLTCLNAACHKYALDPTQPCTTRYSPQTCHLLTALFWRLAQFVHECILFLGFLHRGFCAYACIWL